MNENEGSTGIDLRLEIQALKARVLDVEERIGDPSTAPPASEQGARAFRDVATAWAANPCDPLYVRAFARAVVGSVEGIRRQIASVKAGGGNGNH
jgi:hypothetical protein